MVKIVLIAFKCKKKWWVGHGDSSNTPLAKYMTIEAWAPAIYI